jgi:hypothetical protein
MTLRKHAIVVMALVVGLVIGCSTGSIPKEEGDVLMKRAQASRQEWNKVDPQFEAFATVKASFTRKANTSATPISPRCRLGSRRGSRITAS